MGKLWGKYIRKDTLVIPKYFKTTYVEQLWAQISGTYITFTTEGADSYSIFIQYGQVVAETAIHIPDAMEPRRQ